MDTKVYVLTLLLLSGIVYNKVKDRLQPVDVPNRRWSKCFDQHRVSARCTSHEVALSDTRSRVMSSFLVIKGPLMNVLSLQTSIE